VPAAFALYDDKHEGQANWGCSRAPLGCRSTEARKIQDDLRGHWKGEDAFGEIRTVAGLDASFVLTGSQALKKPVGRWNRLREANRAIGCAVMYRFPEMEEIERAYAIMPLDFPYVPGLLSFRKSQCCSLP